MMRRLIAAIFFVPFLIFGGDCYCRDNKVDKIIDHIEQTPRQKENHISSLVAYLIKPFDNDYDKAQAIAFWIASHINYDTYLYNSGKATKLFDNYRGQTAGDLLKSRVGICGDFAELFAVMCGYAGIKARKVYGYVYRNTQKPNAEELHNYGHAWNQFMYEGNFINVDTTFMSRGTTKLSGKATNNSRRRVLREIRNENKRNSQIKDFDSFYFDFNYRDEKNKRGYNRTGNKTSRFVGQ